MDRELPRRTVLRTSVGTLTAGLALTGCDALETDPAGSAKSGSDSATPSGMKEAPMLAKRVKEGQLPSLKERLPESPMVVKPVERPGTYGGTWHTAMNDPADTWYRDRVLYDFLVRWDPHWTKTIPNIAKSVDVQGDGREYTFHLRKGMRWSDGKPFTAADVIFAVEDVLLDEDLTPVVPSWLSPTGEPPQVNAPDDQTVRFTFAEPHGLFLERVATPSGRALTGNPRHFLKQFHKKYNNEAAQLAKKSGFSDWVKLYQSKSNYDETPDLPTLEAWIATSALGKGNRMVFERNPYYWKTDPDGRQLPYLDRVEFALVDDDEVILLKASHGELDMHCRHINTLRNKPVLAKNRKVSSYRFFDEVPAIMNDMMVALNLTHEDRQLREIFQNKDFRIGLSMAINRPELIKTIVQGQDEVWQGAPREESEFYDRGLATQYTTFDLDSANHHLDKAGITERDPQGHRLRPDGKRIFFAVEVPTPTLKNFWVDAMELIKGYWGKVGIDIGVKNEDRGLFYERKEANKHDAGVWQGDGGLQDAILDPRWYMPYSAESVYATPWAAWFASRGSEGQKPPAPARKQMELYRQLESTADKEKQADLYRQLLAIAREQFWVIGTMLPTQGYGIVKDDFHNVPKSMPNAYLYPTPAPTNPEQYFID